MTMSLDVISFDQAAVSPLGSGQTSISPCSFARKVSIADFRLFTPMTVTLASKGLELVESARRFVMFVLFLTKSTINSE